MEVVGITTGTKYKIKRLNFGERNKILDESSIADPETGVIRLMSGTMRALYIHYGITKPKLSLEDIAKLDETEGQQLFIAIRNYCFAPLESLQQRS